MRFSRDDAFKIWDQDRFVVVLDHRVPPTTVSNAEHQQICREFAKKLQVKHFYDVYPGICHQIMIEKGHVRRGELIVGADSHATAYGASMLKKRVSVWESIPCFPPVSVIFSKKVMR
jgi:3-isopropylmalate/(R)-2-methylmalate dehydratase large subunit